MNKLTPAQAERLTMLAEECGEIVQAVTKILRHGYESKSPLLRYSPTNKEHLEKEISDLMGVVHGLTEIGDLNHLPWSSFPEVWKKKLKWTHHQG